MTAYIKIIRIPNLVIVILTQYLLRFCVIRTFYGLEYVSPALSEFDFVILVLSTILIAAGGYIINDLYDLQTDKINKPGKILIGKSISSQKAHYLYWGLTVPGVLMGFYLSIKVNYIMLGFIYIAIAMMLWFYSARYQKTVLWGNIAISLLSAMVVLIVWLFEFFALREEPLIYVDVMNRLQIITLIVSGYALFAFLVSLIREIIKDIEDIEGDRKAGYRTLPIVTAINKAKGTATGIIVISILLLAFTQYFLYMKELSLIFWYLMIAVQSLFIYLLYNTFKAREKENFHFLSNTTKIIMVAGILSMQLFCISV